MFIVANLALSPAKSCIWFTPSELDSFGANAKAQAHAVRQLMRSVRCPGACDILGMEKFLTLELTREYAVRRRRRTYAVLEEARFQRLACARHDPHRSGGSALRRENAARLAAVSAKESRWAREHARAAALFLARDLEDERRRCLERQCPAEEKLKLKNEVYSRARRMDYSLGKTIASVKWGHRSSFQETVRAL